jgi:non-specific serine/threonine protein kinase
MDGGVWFVDLSSARNDTVEDAMASALGLTPDPESPVLARVSRNLRDRLCLIILDNCEHVLDGVARIVEHMTAAVSGARLLVTSREPLNVEMELVHRVPPLSLPEKGASTVEAVRESEAVHMFELRAALQDKGFKVDSDNAVHVASICRRLDGLPLAIELAAAQTDLLSADQLDERLAKALLDVRGEARGTITRHETMRAAIAWSYEGLSPEEKDFFIGLGVFCGGFTLDAVESVFGANSYGLLRSLTRKNLAQVEDAGTQKRFRLLETIRSYSCELGGPVREQAEADHAKWFADYVMCASRELNGPKQSDCMFRLATDYDNIRAALLWTRSNRPESFANMCLALGRFWQRQGMMREGKAWILSAIQEGCSAEPVVCAKLCNLLGVFSWNLLEFAEADTFLQQAFTRFVQLGETALAAAARTNQGILAGDRNQRHQAMAFQTESVALFESIGDASGAAKARFNLGVTLVRIGELEEAAEALLKAMVQFESENDLARRANAMINLAEIRTKQHEPQIATDLLSDAFALLRDNPSVPFLGHGLLVASLAAMELEDFVAAASLLGAAEAEFVRTESSMSPVELEMKEAVIEPARQALGTAKFERRRLDGQAEVVTKAVELIRMIGHLCVDRPASEDDAMLGSACVRTSEIHEQSTKQI